MKPKYEIGDDVWIIEYGKAVNKKVFGIVLLVRAAGERFKYRLRQHHELDNYDWESEDRLFATKEALIASL